MILRGVESETSAGIEHRVRPFAVVMMARADVFDPFKD